MEAGRIYLLAIQLKVDRILSVETRQLYRTVRSAGCEAIEYVQLQLPEKMQTAFTAAFASDLERPGVGPYFFGELCMAARETWC